MAEHGQLLDLDEDLDPAQIPPGVRRVVAVNARGGAVRKAKLEEDEHRLIYKIEAYYGQSNAKVKLKNCPQRRTSWSRLRLNTALALPGLTDFIRQKPRAQYGTATRPNLDVPHPVA